MQKTLGAWMLVGLAACDCGGPIEEAVDGGGRAGDGGAGDAAIVDAAAADAMVTDAAASDDAAVPAACIERSLLGETTELEGVEQDTDGVFRLIVGPSIAAPVPDGDSDGVPDVADDFPADPARTGVEGGFAVTLGAGESQVVDLVLGDIQLRVDVYFLVDTSSSDTAIFETLRTALTDDVVDPLCPQGILGAIECLGTDAALGLGRFSDYPVAPYGDPNAACDDAPYEPLLPVGTTTAAIQTAIRTLPTSCGGDGPQSTTQALYAAATGNALGSFVLSAPPCLGGGFGHACFRPGALPLIVVVSGADLHNGPDGFFYDPLIIPSTVQVGYGAMVSSLTAAGVRIIFVDPSGRPSRGDLATLLVDTDSVLTSSPFLISVPPDGGTALGADIVDVVNDAIASRRVDVSLAIEDDPGTSADERTFVPVIGALASTPACAGNDGAGTHFGCRPDAIVRFSLAVTDPGTVPTTDAAGTRIDLPLPLSVNGLEERRVPARVVLQGLAPSFESGSLRQRVILEGECGGTHFSAVTFDADLPGDTAITFTARLAIEEAGLASAMVRPLTLDGAGADLDAAVEAAAAEAGVPAEALRALELEVVLEASSDALQTPVLRGLDLELAAP